MGVAIGIDLGTTNSCVAVVRGKRAKVVEDHSGARIQPSVVSFPQSGETLAGPAARERVVIDPANTVYSFKRMLGRDIDTPELQSMIKEFPYEVTKGPDDIPVIKIRNRELSLPEISAMMLKHLKEMSSASLGIDVEDVVITVPANFNDLQRSSTKIAGRIAGFNVLRILNEPTAAALAYGFGGKLTERIAVYDFGGGTFDITIIELMDDIFEVLSTAGDTYLGGDDFDDLIVKEMIRQFQREHKFDLFDDPVAMQRIRTVAERVKCQLSVLPEVQATLRDIAFDSKGFGIDFAFSLTRTRFEALVGPLIDRSLQTCEDALKLAKMDRRGLDNLIMVGGTTRVPLVKTKVAKYFGRKPRTEINPDEVVAIGAAIHAYSLTGKALPEEIKKQVSKVQMNDRAGLAETIKKSTKPMKLPMPAKLPLEHQRSVPPSTPLKTPSIPSISTLPGGAPFQQPPLSQDEMNFPASLDDDIWGDLSESAEPDKPQTLPLKMASPKEVELLESDLISLDEDLSAPIAIGPANNDVGDIDEFDDFGDIGFSSGSDKPAPSLHADISTPPVASGGIKDHVTGEDRQIEPDDSRKSFSVDVGPTPTKTLLLDVTPRALGVRTAGGFFDEVIERNAAIPMEQSRMFSTSRDNQTKVAINIFQGESRRAEKNTHLAHVELTGIRPAPRGEIKICVTFEINTDGILDVSARNEETGEAQATKVVLSGGLGDDQVNKLVEKYSEQ